MSTSLRVVAVVAVVVALAVGLTAGWSIIDDDAAPSSSPNSEAASPAPPRVTGMPAPIDGPVDRVAPDGDPAAALALVARADTVVVARSGPDAVPAAALALRLRAPLALVPAASGSGQGSSSESPDPRGAAPSEVASAASTVATIASPTDTATPAAADTTDVPQATPSPLGSDGASPSAAPASPTGGSTVDAGVLRQLDAARIVAVGGADVAEVARDAGVDAVVQLQPTGTVRTTATSVLRRASGQGPPIRPTAAGLDPAAVRELARDVAPTAPPTGTAVLVSPADPDALPVAMAARAVGHTVIATRATDIRADARAVQRLAALADDGSTPPVALGGPGMAALEPAAVARHAETAATGVELPGGGQLVIDQRRPTARRYVGLYGVTSSPALGALGEQSIEDSVARAQRMAQEYQQVVPEQVDVLPMFEIIATVASASAGDDGDYSAEQSVAELRPAVEAAGRAGLYVLLDLQPGRTDFVTQAKRYRPLLRQPHVGLALDPEWRLRPDERHLEQIGSVSIEEVNAVGQWLANLVERRDLPQKMLLLHQFRLTMIRDRELLDTSRDELAFVIQMDGQGPQGSKLDTWAAIKADAPPRVHFGWKNFYDEDTPTRSPADTMALDPPPLFVSYQ